MPTTSEGDRLQRLECVTIPVAQPANAKATIHTLLAQSSVPSEYMPTGHGLFGSTQLAAAADALRVQTDTQLRLLTADNFDLAIFSQHPGWRLYSDTELEGIATDTGAVIVLPLGLIEDRSKRFNAIRVAFPGRPPVTLSKVSLSTDDQAQHIEAGSNISLFDGPFAKWVVLNCHDYTHVDVIRRLSAERAELLIVTSHNPATRLYWEYALSDVHRLFSFVILVNISNFGGSAVFAPFRRMGTASTGQIRLAGQLLAATGPSILKAHVNLDIGELRRIRDAYGQDGIDAVPSKVIEPILPPEHFLLTDKQSSVAIQVDTWGATRESDQLQAKAQVMLCQLSSINYPAYLETEYRFSKHPTFSDFQAELTTWLDHVEKLAALPGRCPDFLVFPEIFVPRCLQKRLEDFANRFHCVVIAGMEYQEALAANECVVLIPLSDGTVDTRVYRKLTRSQYDARLPDPNDSSRMGGFFYMEQGDALVRFEHPSLGSFGVLICYDFSHIDLVHSLNLMDRVEPLEVLFIVAHNPFGELYRACCAADAHRYYQYVVMCNVADYGGSGVFAPCRNRPTRQTLVSAGTGVRAILEASMDLDGLRAARRAQPELLSSGDFQRKPGVLARRWANPPQERVTLRDYYTFLK